MPADASIYGLIQQSKPQAGPMDQMGQALQIRHLMDASSLNQLQRGELERGIKDKQLLRDLFSRGNVTPEEVMAVDPTTGMTYQKNLLERKKTQGDIDKTALESRGLEMKQLRDRLATVSTDQQLAQWVQDMQRASGGKAQYDGPASVSDPAFAAWRNQSLMTADQMIERIKPNFQLANLGGTSQVIQTNPNAPNAQTAPLAHTPTPGDVRTAAHQAATLSETKRHNVAVEGQVKYGDPKEMAGPDGKPMLVMQRKSDGALVDANTRQPVAGVGPKPGESAQKQLAGVATVKQAITEYRNALKDWSATDIVMPNARARMGTIYNNMLLQAKEAYNLGVLNGPDYSILQEVITSPASLTGGITSKKAMDDQAAKLDEIMTRVGQAVTQTQSGTTPTVAPKPAAPTFTRAQIDAELKRRGVTR